MIFENLGIYICSVGAVIGFIGVILYWVYVGETARRVSVSDFTTYARYSNLVYLAALLILGFQWLTNADCAELAKILLIALCSAWVVSAVLTLIISFIARNEEIRETIPHCIFKVVLTVITFWLVS